MKTLMVVLIGCLLLGLSGPAAAGPKLEMPAKAVDAGRALEGQVVEGVYDVFNKGDEELKIKKVTPG